METKNIICTRNIYEQNRIDSTGELVILYDSMIAIDKDI
jgi:hypothetical protein